VRHGERVEREGEAAERGDQREENRRRLARDDDERTARRGRPQAQDEQDGATVDEVRRMADRVLQHEAADDRHRHQPGSPGVGARVDATGTSESAKKI